MEAPHHALPFRELAAAGLVNEPTRTVLKQRLERPDTQEPAFFNAGQFDTLRAVCHRLIPQPPQASGVDLPGLLDAQLAAGVGKGWRYNVLPPEEALFRGGMDLLQTLARRQHGVDFTALDAAQQDAVLQAVQAGTLPDATWPSDVARRFFEDLLAGLVELYFSHPAAKAWISDTSYADAQGWSVDGTNPKNF